MPLPPMGTWRSQGYSTGLVVASESQAPDGRTVSDERRWLTLMVLGGALVSLATAVVGIGYFVTGGLGAGPELVVAGTGAVLAPALLVAYWALRRGRPSVAATIAATALLLASVVVALLIPGEVAQPSIFAVLAFTVARQEVRGRRLVLLGVACWAIGVLDFILMLWGSGYGRGLRDVLFGVGPVAGLLGLLIGLLAWFSERTGRALDEERTAREQLLAANAQLDASRRFAAQVTNATPGFIIVTDLGSGLVSYANSALEELVAEHVGTLSMQDVVDRTIHPADRAAERAMRESLAAAQDDGIRTCSARVLERHGWRWHDIRGKVFRRNEDGTPSHLLLVALDSTRERSATLQRDRFFELAGDAFVVVGQDARIVEASPNLAGMLGIAREQLVGYPMRGIGHPDDRPIAAQLMRDLAHGLPQGTITMRHQDTAGEWRSIEWTLGIDPEELVMYGTARDVTDRNSTREALEKARRMETVGRLAGGVAHDVNNSLTAIGGFAHLIAEESQDPEVRDLAHEIRTAVDRTAAMTRKLLAFSRRQAMTPRVVDLGSVLDGLGPLAAQLAGDGVTLEVDLRPVPRVLVDPAGVEQILMNLVVNARDAMGGNGHLVIRCRTVDLDAAEAARLGLLQAGCQAELVVEDDGAGMTEAVRSRIFEPFFSTKGDAGTGLGLAIVHGLVTGVGGAIVVDSEPGQGTRVRILLPEATASLDPVAVASDRLAETPSRHVLIVEDEPTIRRLAERMLVRAGHLVTSAPDGESALVALARMDATSRVDIVITDIVMPGMSGIDLAYAIRMRHPDLPIVFTTGYDQGLMPVDGPFAGARLLEKPYEAGELEAVVSEVLRRGPLPGRVADTETPDAGARERVGA
jgi:two-component system, cell cycle sensor histidine kinase and response regulator CckA